jgi:hypothetical protein
MKITIANGDGYHWSVKQQSNQNQNQMQQEVIETVMNELLQEQKVANDNLNEVTGGLKELGKQVRQFEEQLSRVKLSVPPVNTIVLEVLLQKYLAEMQTEMERLRSFIINERKRKSIEYIMLRCLPWVILCILFYVIFKIAIGC